jgi:hypothetical protein
MSYPSVHVDVPKGTQRTSYRPPQRFATANAHALLTGEQRYQAEA